MQIELSERARALVERCLAMGYKSPEAVVEQALLDMAEAEERTIEDELRPAYESALRGEGRDGFEVLAELRALVHDTEARRRNGAA